MLELGCRRSRPEWRKKPQTLSERFCVKIEVPEAGEAVIVKLFNLPTTVKMLKNTDVLVRQP